jgi:hypothetical protein
VLHRLIYISSSTGADPQKDLQDIERIAANRNRDRELTGVLICAGGAFLQVIEGPEAHVSACFATIKTDRRHTNVIVMFQGDVADRAFPSWSMKCEFRDPMEPVSDKMRRLQEDTQMHASSSREDAEALSLIKSFLRINRD